MIRYVIAAVLSALLSFAKVQAQACVSMGQTPSSAFPVCGESVFQQTTVPICESHSLYVPGCNDGAGYSDKNPYWYKFTCYQTGTLGFIITPIDQGDDYDWQLYDITGLDPNEVFTNKNIIVTGNWAGTYGNTGTASNGATNIQCSSDPRDNRPSFAAMPTLVQGHQYLLMVSHFTNSQSGYKLEFKGGTALITDKSIPAFKGIQASCSNNQLRIKLSKKILCSSLAANGSDFSLSPALATVTGAVGIGCSTGFDTDSLILTLSSSLPSGNYDVVAKNGTDGNTVMDYCNNTLPVGSKIGGYFAQAAATPMDSIMPVQCKPSVLTLVFKQPINCASIAPDGSDFSISGPQALTIASAAGACSNGLTSTIRLNLSSPINVAGTYTIRLQQGSDGNTLINECNRLSPPGAVQLRGYDTVSSKFSYNIVSSCVADTIHLANGGGNGIRQWVWKFDDGSTASGPSAIKYYTTNGNKSASLMVTNGVCADSSMQSISLNNTKLKAAFFSQPFVCPEDFAILKNESTGPITSYLWNLGNGQSSTQKDPPDQKYAPQNTGLASYFVKLVIYNSANGCADSITHKLQVPVNCYIAVPSGFTPNGDGKNDYLYPLNAYKAEQLEFKVFNRYGQLVWQTTDWTRKWNGTINGEPQPTGTYVWMLTYIHADTKQRITMEGTAVLIR